MSVNSKMQAIADAIRAKTGKGAKLSLDAMATEIAALDVNSNGYVNVFFNEIYGDAFAMAGDIYKKDSEGNVIEFIGYSPAHESIAIRKNGIVVIMIESDDSYWIYGMTLINEAISGNGKLLTYRVGSDDIEINTYPS